MMLHHVEQKSLGAQWCFVRERAQIVACPTGSLSTRESLDVRIQRNPTFNLQILLVSKMIS